MDIPIKMNKMIGRDGGGMSFFVRGLERNKRAKTSHEKADEFTRLAGLHSLIF